MITRYDVLGVAETATREEIELAYRRLAKWMHPDRHPADPEDGSWRNPWPTRILQLINEARDTLVDSESRAQYDARLRAWRENQAMQAQPPPPQPAPAPRPNPFSIDGVLDGVADSLRKGVHAFGEELDARIRGLGKRR